MLGLGLGFCAFSAFSLFFVLLVPFSWNLVGFCYKLRSLSGNTALHDAAEAGDLEIFKLLLKHGAVMKKDAFGTTPILTAAAIGHANIVKYLAEHCDCDLGERINGLELLGATYVDKLRDLHGGRRLWTQALEMRLDSPDELGLRTKPFTAPIPAYDHQSEVNSIDELQKIMGEPDAMRMQALLVRERILGKSHPDTSYYIRFRGAVYMDLSNYDRCYDLWIYAMQLQQEILEPLCVITLGSLIAFTELFAYVLSETVRNRIATRRQEMGLKEKVPRPSDVLAVLQTAVIEVQRAMLSKDPLCVHHHQASHETTRESQMHKVSLVCLHLSSIFCRLEMQSLPEHDREFKSCLYNLVRLNPTGDKSATLLHLACSSDSSIMDRQPVSRFPYLPVIRSLLSVDVDADSRDAAGNTPLHVLLRNKVGRPSIVRCLLDAGAHLDTRNRMGIRPLDLLKPLRGCEDSNVRPLEYTTLKCLAARCIKDYNIVYRHLIADLQKFVDLH